MQDRIFSHADLAKDLGVGNDTVAYRCKKLAEGQYRTHLARDGKYVSPKGRTFAAWMLDIIAYEMVLYDTPSDVSEEDRASMMDKARARLDVFVKDRLIEEEKKPARVRPTPKNTALADLKEVLDILQQAKELDEDIFAYLKGYMLENEGKLPWGVKDILST